MASYPAAIAALTTVDADNTAAATNHKNDHNNANGEINAIETELGTLPKGGFATVKARLDKHSAKDIVTGNLSADTGLPNGWTDLISLVIPAPSDSTVFLWLHGCLDFQSTGAGGPGIALGIFDNSNNVIIATGQEDLQGSTVATQPILNAQMEVDAFLQITAGATYKLRGWKNASGSGNAIKTRTLSAIVLLGTSFTGITY